MQHPFCRGAEGRPTIPPRADQRGQLRAAWGLCASLNCSIYYNFLRQLLRTPLWRSSQNPHSTHYGAYCWQQQAQVQEGGSMPTRDKRLLTDLRCRKHDHPFKAEIWQRLHYVAHSNEIVGKTTPKGALDNVRCPICGSPAKEP